MMKYGLTLLVLILIISCDQKDNTKDVYEKLLNGEFEAYTFTDRVLMDSIKLDSNNLYLIKDTILFTGIAYRNYPNLETTLEEKQIFQGKMHGHHLLYSINGDTISMNLYKSGILIRKSIGKDEVIPCDSLVNSIDDEGNSIYYYFEEPYTGRCQKYYPAPDSNQIYISIPYLNGIIDGEVYHYNKSAEVILTEHYAKGKKIEF